MLRKLLEGFAIGVVIAVAVLGATGAWYMVVRVALPWWSGQ